MNAGSLLRRSVRGVLDRFLEDQPKVLVVASPRSGFTLLISVIGKLLNRRRFRSNLLSAQSAC